MATGTNDTGTHGTEQSATADLAQDSRTFVDAVAAELRDWNVYLERLQVKAAATGGEAREVAEAMVTYLRSRRNTLSQRLAEVCTASGEGWRERREPVHDAREQLVRSAAEVQAWFDERRTP